MERLTDERKQLVENNHNLIYAFLNRHQLDIDDYYDIAAIGLCKAALSYDPEKSRFSTYAYRCMYNEILMNHKKNHRSIVIPNELIVYTNDDITIEDTIASNINIEHDVIFKIAIENVRSMLKKSIDIQIFDLLYDGFTQLEINNILKISQPTISRHIKKFYEIFKQVY